MRIREGTRITPRALLVTDLQYTMHPISLETGRELKPSQAPVHTHASSMPRLTASGDRLWLLYEKELQILDTEGTIIGSDASSRTQNHRFEAVAPYADGLILIDQASTQSNRRLTTQMATSGHQYKLHVLSPGGRGIERVDLFDLDSRIRAVRAMDGVLLLSTDEEVLAVKLPPAVENADP